MDQLVFTFAQAAAAGFTTEHIAVRVRRRQWARLYPRVYAASVAPLPGHERWRAALLYAGPDAALSHLTAARLHGLVGDDGAIHVLVPHNRRVASQPGLRVHRSRLLVPPDVRRRHGLAVTSVERTVADALLLLGRTAEARALAAAAVQQRQSTVPQLAAVAERVRGIRAPWIVDLFADLGGGSQSELELRFLQLCRDYGLPLPDRQRRVGPYHVDAAFRDALVELDSRRFHAGAAEWERDLWRQNDLVREGGRVLRFNWQMVCDEPGRVAAAIRAALAVPPPS